MKRIVLLLGPALALAGCATKDYVNQQVTASSQAMETRMDGQRAELSGRLDQVGRDSAARDQELRGRIDGQQAAVDSASATAREALERALAAGKLAQGKFLYEMTIGGEIAFPLESSSLTEEARQALDEFADMIKSENKNVFIEIQGHTDSSGSHATNLKLGEERAEAVRRYLAVEHCFPLHRMNVISYGESMPIADNRTRAGRIENRRVTLVILQ